MPNAIKATMPTFTVRITKPTSAGCGAITTYSITPEPTNEREVVAASEAAYAAIVDMYVASGLNPSYSRRVARETAVYEVLSPIMGRSGVWSWFVRPAPRESIRAYARRAARCAAARCAEAGVASPTAVSHEGAELIGMHAAHVGAANPVHAVSRLELASSTAD